MMKIPSSEIGLKYVSLLAKSDKAYLIGIGGNTLTRREMWLPISQIRWRHAFTEIHDCGSLIVTRWWFEQQGLTAWVMKSSSTQVIEEFNHSRIVSDIPVLQDEKVSEVFDELAAQLSHALKTLTSSVFEALQLAKKLDSGNAAEMTAAITGMINTEAAKLNKVSGLVRRRINYELTQGNKPGGTMPSKPKSSADDSWEEFH